METDVGGFIGFILMLVFLGIVFKFFFARKPSNLKDERPSIKNTIITKRSSRAVISILTHFGQRKNLELVVLNEDDNFLVFKRPFKIGHQAILIPIYLSCTSEKTTLEIGITNEVLGGNLEGALRNELQILTNEITISLKDEGIAEGNRDRSMKNNISQVSTSKADEILKLSKLKDSGILTQEEFDEQKKITLAA